MNIKKFNLPSTFKQIQAKSKNVDLFLTEVPFYSKLGKDELLVKLRAATMHPSDAIRAKGLFGPVSYPLGMGVEGYGKVIQDSNDKITGKYVSFRSNSSSWSEYAIVPLKDCMITKEYEKEKIGQATNFWLVPITSLGIMEKIKHHNTKAWALNAANASVSKVLIKLAKINNIKTLAIVRKESQTEELLNIGADAVINSSKESFYDDLKEQYNKMNITFFLDCIGGKDAEKMINPLKDKSVLFYYGALSGNYIDQEYCKTLTEKRGFHCERFISMNFFDGLNDHQKEEYSKYIEKHLDTIFYTKVNKYIKINDVPEAYYEYLGNMSKGKIIIDYDI